MKPSFFSIELSKLIQTDWPKTIHFKTPTFIIGTFLLICIFWNNFRNIALRVRDSLFKPFLLQINMFNIWFKWLKNYKSLDCSYIYFWKKKDYWEGWEIWKCFNYNALYQDYESLIQNICISWSDEKKFFSWNRLFI